MMNIKRIVGYGLLYGCTLTILFVGVALAIESKTPMISVFDFLFTLGLGAGIIVGLIWTK